MAGRFGPLERVPEEGDSKSGTTGLNTRPEGFPVLRGLPARSDEGRPASESAGSAGSAAPSAGSAGSAGAAGSGGFGGGIVGAGLGAGAGAKSGGGSGGGGGAGQQEIKRVQFQSPAASLVGEGAGEFKGGTRTSGTATGAGAAGTATKKASKWENLQNLKNLLSAGFITQQEYDERKAQLVDELTGTTTTQTQTQTHTRKKRDDSHLPVVVPRGPPDFKQLPIESATKFVYDLASRTWQASKCQVKLDTTPFSRGALRLVYHILDMSEELTNKEKKISYVAKISMDPRDNNDRDIYYRDVEMQAVAAYYAQQYNDYRPPKSLEFVKAWILQLDDREGAPLCAVERFIDGPYRKHNNNFGYVSEEERNTPQAFSHFTYESSGHQLLCVDIQGVSDMYTDPQVHSADGKGFGKGNMGQRGIDKFLAKHRCNAICRYLKLPSINANYNNLGTLPVTRLMSYEHVEVVNITSFPQRSGPPPLITVRTPLISAQGGVMNSPAKGKRPATSSSSEDDSEKSSSLCACAIL